MNTLPVTFHDNTLYLIEYNGEPYAPMKPIVEGIGLDWRTQQRKLSDSQQRFSMVKMTIQLPSDNQRRETLLIPLRKLFGWLCTISPNKVKPELKERIIQYQNECDEVLYQHWTQSQQQPEPTYDVQGEIEVDIGTGCTASAVLINGEPWLSEHSIEKLIDYRLRRSVRKLHGANQTEFPEDTVLYNYHEYGETMHFNPKGCIILASKSTKPLAVKLQIWAVEYTQGGKVLVDKEDLRKLAEAASRSEEGFRAIAQGAHQINQQLADSSLPVAIAKLTSEKLIKH